MTSLTLKKIMTITNAHQLCIKYYKLMISPNESHSEEIFFRFHIYENGSFHAKIVVFSYCRKCEVVCWEGNRNEIFLDHFAINYSMNKLHLI